MISPIWQAFYDDRTIANLFDLYGKDSNDPGEYYEEEHTCLYCEQKVTTADEGARELAYTDGNGTRCHELVCGECLTEEFREELKDFEKHGTVKYYPFKP